METLVGIFLKCLGGFFCLFPRTWILAWGRKVGHLLLACGFRKQVVIDNLKLAYPEWSEEQRQEFLRRNYEHYGILFLDFLQTFSDFKGFVDRYCEVEHGEYLVNAVAKGNGAVVISSHLGNWEMLAPAGAYILGIPSTMVTKRLKPEWFHQIIEKTRARLGIRMAFEPKTMKTILQTLKEGGIVGFVMDQYTGAPVGARVPFFNIPVGSHTALAGLILRTKAPLVPAQVFRTSEGKYRVRFEPEMPVVEFPEDKDRSILQNTANFVNCTERWVREYPEQWLWIHKRWKGDLSPLPANTVGELLR